MIDVLIWAACLAFGYWWGAQRDRDMENRLAKVRADGFTDGVTTTLMTLSKITTQQMLDALKKK